MVVQAEKSEDVQSWFSLSSERLISKFKQYTIHTFVEMLTWVQRKLDTNDVQLKRKEVCVEDWYWAWYSRPNDYLGNHLKKPDQGRRLHEELLTELQ